MADDVTPTPPPANVDTLIYQINLDPTSTGPTFNPGVATTYAAPGDFYETANINNPGDTLYIGADDISSSTTATAVPEPMTVASGAIVAGLAGAYMLVRRRSAALVQPAGASPTTT